MSLTSKVAGLRDKALVASVALQNKLGLTPVPAATKPPEAEAEGEAELQESFDAAEPREGEEAA